MKLSLGIDIGSSSTKAAALDEHGALLGTLQFTRMTRAPRLTVFSGVSWISRALRLTMLKNRPDRARFDVFP